MSAFTARAIAAPTHGRYLMAAPPGEADIVLVGFHGYAEAAEVQFDRLASIPGADRAVLIAIQALHRFYRGRTTDVVASWMTRQDRELAIADNLAYVEAVIREVVGDRTPRILFSGFSQGVAMAFRAACASTRRVGGVIALGSDVPPELEADALRRLPAVLLGRGERDTWYTADKMTEDLKRLTAAGVNVDDVLLDAGHEWTAPFSESAGRLLTGH